MKLACGRRLTAATDFDWEFNWPGHVAADKVRDPGSSQCQSTGNRGNFGWNFRWNRKSLIYKSKRENGSDCADYACVTCHPISSVLRSFLTWGQHRRRFGSVSRCSLVSSLSYFLNFESLGGQISFRDWSFFDPSDNRMTQRSQTDECVRPGLQKESTDQTTKAGEHQFFDFFFRKETAWGRETQDEE